MAIDLGRIAFWVGPNDLGAPDSLLDAIVDFIDGARDTLDIAVQELESRPIAEAIVRASVRGVKVRMVLEHDYLTVDQIAGDPFTPGGENRANRELHSALLRSRVDVRTDLNPKIFHQKFVVRDLESSSRSAVLSGSTNFTPTGVGSNLNHVVVVSGKRVARLFAEEFDEIWGGTYGTKRQRHDPAPRAYTVSNVRVKTLFAPDHAPEMELMKQMMKARERIDFAIFTFSRSSGIDDTLSTVQRSGVQVRGILDAMQGNQDWAATHPLAANGVEVHLARRRQGLNKLHHKLAVIDDQVVIAGSFNYTEPATKFNDENVLVIGDLDEEDPAAIAQQRQLARYAREEIDRMIDRHGVLFTSS